MCDKPRDPVEAEDLRRSGTPGQLVGPATKTYTFTLFAQGADILGDASMDALYEAGCDDATFGARDGAQYGEFDREATSFSNALSSAIHAMTNALALIDEALSTSLRTAAAQRADRALSHRNTDRLDDVIDSVRGGGAGRARDTSTAFSQPQDERRP